MIPKTLKQAIDEQIKLELNASHIYLSMSIYLSNEGWSGFAKWFAKQADEEYQHAITMIRYVLSRGEMPILAGVEAPESDFKSVLHTFEKSYEHECNVSKAINNIVTIAIKETDYATENFFRTFVDEQVEEEETVADIINKLKLIDKNPAGLMTLDSQLGAR
ncbi:MULTISPECIES: ferritin [Porphyromonas]|uniref:Ferritin n=1 Tax=Porphyromonas canoris TaxID=36875 RepID=A0ABR4XMJ1_9PORP|nr:MULTISPECIES: ferritin [Porphyromonas]KGN67311.1 hypothetical protein JT26_08660 [Porphyromonas sp. COT-108 OH1349]KGN93321.1 hypothetical protein HQ43_01360 [Porphyromonas canoris]